MTRLLLLAVALVATAVVLIAAEPAPVGPRPPSIELPHDELAPQQVFRVMADDGPDWGVVKLGCPAAWAVTKGAGVKVAVLDTGCDTNHPDLRSHVKSADDCKDFTRSASGYLDRQGHGTHCAGSAVASGPLPGVAPAADLIVGKVLGDSGSGGVDGIAAGIRWATGRGADVISMSLGGASADSWIPPALAEADAAGVIVIAAAGNEGPREGTCGYPGRYPQCVAVAAVDPSLRAAGFSSRCSAVFVAAPGVNVRSTYPGGQYATMSGTSMATPHVAGLAALWVSGPGQSVPKKERPAAFRKALQAVSADLAPAGRDTATGWGFPDAAKLVAGASPPPPKPMPGVVIDLKPGDVVPPGVTVRIEVPAPVSKP